MKVLEKITGLTAASILMVMGSSAGYAQSSLSDLLNAVENDRVAESEEYQQRLQEFEQNAARQTEILEITEGRITEQENLQVQLSDQFEANEVIIADKREVLRNRRGDLNELFGTLQGVAGDFLSNFQNSLISAQFPAEPVNSKSLSSELAAQSSNSTSQKWRDSGTSCTKKSPNQAVSSLTTGKLLCLVVKRPIAQ